MRIKVVPRVSSRPYMRRYPFFINIARRENNEQRIRHPEGERLY